MAWQRVHAVVSQHAASPLGDALEAAGALAVTLVDAADDPVFEPLPGTTPLWQATRVEALFDADFDWEHAVTTAALSAGVAVPAWQRELLADRAWERAWLDRFAPMRFGERLCICPSAFDPPADAQVVLRLDPGLAFGTGTHPTTALCLELLDQHVHSAINVVDYGCGSGVLAIAALLLGAEAAYATDIDPQALTATETNAQSNDVTERVHLVANPDDLPQCELVMANILAGPLVELAPRLAALTLPGGRIILSGLLAEQGDTIRTTYAGWFDLEPTVRQEEWVAITGVRSATSAVVS
jgi:ribosomal protein L11 methyltransferase